MSCSLTDPSWQGTIALSDVATDVRAQKHRFDEIQVIGSGDPTRSLLEVDLVDRLDLDERAGTPVTGFDMSRMQRARPAPRRPSTYASRGFRPWTHR